MSLFAEILGAIELFLAERKVSGTLYSLNSDTPYLEICRNKTVFTIEIHDDRIHVEANCKSFVNIANFELANKNCMQALYEHIMNKRWKSYHEKTRRN